MALPAMPRSRERHTEKVRRDMKRTNYFDDAEDDVGFGDSEGDFLMHSVFACVGSPRPPSRPRGTPLSPKKKEVTLASKFEENETLKKLLCVIRELPIYSKRLRVLKEEKIVLDKVFDKLMWKIYFSKNEKVDPVLEDSLREAELSVSPRKSGKEWYSRENILAETGQCRLSLSIAADCLRQLGEYSEVLRLIHEQLAPAIFTGFKLQTGVSVYSSIPWVAAAITGESIDPDRPDVLENLFNRATMERRAMFLAKIFTSIVSKESTSPEIKDRSDSPNLIESIRRSSSASSVSTLSKSGSEHYHENGECEDMGGNLTIKLDGVPLQLSYKDDSLQLALRAMGGAPIGLLDLILRTFDLDDINNNLTEYTILPRLGKMLGRKSLKLLGSRRKRLGRVNTMSSEEDCEGENDFEEDETKSCTVGDEANDEISDQIANSPLVYQAEDNPKIRRRLLQNLIILEDNDAFLSEIVVLLLDQFHHTNRLDAFVSNVLNSDAEAVHEFVHALHELSSSDKVTHLNSGVPLGSPPTPLGNFPSEKYLQQVANHQLSHHQLSLQNSFKATPSGGASFRANASFKGAGNKGSFRRESWRRGNNNAREMSFKDAKSLLQDQQLDERAFTFEDLPSVFKMFLANFDTTAEKKHILATHGVLDLVILDIFLWKISTDRARYKNGLGKRPFPMDFSNEPLLATYVVEYFIHQFGTKAVAQAMLSEFLMDLNEQPESNRWAHMFRVLCGLVKEQKLRCHALYQSVLDCILLGLDMISSALPFVDVTGLADNNLPSVEAKLCISCIQNLQSHLPYLDVEAGAKEFEKARVLDKSTPNTDISVRTYLHFIFRAAVGAAVDRGSSLDTVFHDFGKSDASIEYDLEMFQSLVNCGLERLHKRPRNQALLPEIFSSLMCNVSLINSLSYSQAVLYYCRPFPETSVYTDNVQMENSEVTAPESQN